MRIILACCLGLGWEILMFPGTPSAVDARPSEARATGAGNAMGGFGNRGGAGGAGGVPFVVTPSP